MAIMAGKWRIEAERVVDCVTYLFQGCVGHIRASAVNFLYMCSVDHQSQIAHITKIHTATQINSSSNFGRKRFATAIGPWGQTQYLISSIIGPL